MHSAMLYQALVCSVKRNCKSQTMTCSHFHASHTHALSSCQANIGIKLSSDTVDTKSFSLFHSGRKYVPAKLQTNQRRYTNQASIKKASIVSVHVFTCVHMCSRVFTRRATINPNIPTHTVTVRCAKYSDFRQVQISWRTVVLLPPRPGKVA